MLDFIPYLPDPDRLELLWLPILLGTLPMLLAYYLDRRYGDPEGWHPIITFGSWIAWGERRLNQGQHRRLKGALYNASLVLASLIIGLLIVLLQLLPVVSLLAYALIVLLCFYMLAGKTLESEVRGVFTALDEGGLEAGRRQVARIVGRDTAQLSEQEVRKAALETLAENLSDGVIAPMLSWAVLGLPGILGYKMVNTQDSMVGYLTSRYRAYGFFSAKLDDLVNLIPARVTMLLMLLASGDLGQLPQVWRHGRRHLSPNSGYPEAALAFALSLRFGGPHDYHGELIDKPYIGASDRAILPQDVEDAIRITRRAAGMGLALSLLIRALILWVCYDLLFLLVLSAIWSD